MTEKKVMKLASRGKRFGAACIDLALPVLAYLIYMAVLAANGMLSSQPGYGYGNEFGYGYGYGYNYGYESRHLSGMSAGLLAVISLLLIIYIIVECVFYAKGKSIGKALLGLQVVSSTDGKPFRFWKMMLRECIVKNASGSVLALGFIWILIDDKNRGWHDKILDSYVVDLKESEKMHLKRSLAHAEDMAYKAERAPALHDSAPSAEHKKEEAVVNEPAAIEGPSAEAVPDAVAEAYEMHEDDDVIEVKAELVDETAETQEAAGDEAAAVSVNMSMKKEELLETARAMGIKVNSRSTKAEIIEAIENENNRQDRTE